MSEWRFGSTDAGHSNSARCEQERCGRSFGMPFVHGNAAQSLIPHRLSFLQVLNEYLGASPKGPSPIGTNCSGW